MHPARTLPFKASAKRLSVRLPGPEKSRITPIYEGPQIEVRSMDLLSDFMEEVIERLRIGNRRAVLMVDDGKGEAVAAGIHRPDYTFATKSSTMVARSSGGIP